MRTMSFLSKLWKYLFPSPEETPFSLPADGTDQATDAEGKKVLESIKSDLATRNVQFVEPMPKEVQTECSICLSVLLEPYIVDCCGNRFCKTCIETVAQFRQPCPLCKCKYFQKIPDKHLQRLLKQRKVYCLLKDEGCAWIGAMDALQEHLQLTVEEFSLMQILGVKDVTSCEYVPIHCSQCKLLFPRRTIMDHKVTCPMREVRCVYCEVYACPLRDVSDHYENCPSFPMLCPRGCAPRTHKREDLKAHLESECPLQEVNCEYHYAGCQVRMLRMDMPDHLETNTEKHLSLVSSKYKDIEAKYENLKENTTESKAIKFLYVSNLPAAAHYQMLHSRFGQFGVVSSIDMVPSRSAAIIEFATNGGYTKTLSASRYQINLLKHSLQVTPMYSSPGTAFEHAFTSFR